MFLSAISAPLVFSIPDYFVGYYFQSKLHPACERHDCVGRGHFVPDNISSTTESGRDVGRLGSAGSGAAFTSTGVKHKHNTKTLSVGNWNTSSGVGKLKIHKFVGRAGLRPWVKRTPRSQPAYWGGRRVLWGGGGQRAEGRDQVPSPPRHGKTVRRCRREGGAANLHMRVTRDAGRAADGAARRWTSGERSRVIIAGAGEDGMQKLEKRARCRLTWSSL